MRPLNLTKEKPYKIYGENIEEGAIAQFEEVINQDFVIKAALLPDAHQGYSMPIGGVAACKDVIVPAYIGYDIGCGVAAFKTAFNYEDAERNAKDIFDNIYRDIPVDFNHNKHEVPTTLNHLEKTKVIGDLIKNGAFKQLGTLGSGK